MTPATKGKLDKSYGSHVKCDCCNSIYEIMTVDVSDSVKRLSDPIIIPESEAPQAE